MQIPELILKLMLGGDVEIRRLGSKATIWARLILTSTIFCKDASGGMRETNIQGTFKTYGEARAAAASLLVNEKDGLTKESWAEHDELPVGGRDGEYGENVVVHAIPLAGNMDFLASGGTPPAV